MSGYEYVKRANVKRVLQRGYPGVDGFQIGLAVRLRIEGKNLDTCSLFLWQTRMIEYLSRL